MANMYKVCSGISIDKLLDKINKNESCWNQITLRTYHPDSPHYQCGDIWIRFNDTKNYDSSNPQTFMDKHESVWYPSGLTDEVKHIVSDLERLCKFSKNYELGGILITRIPAGGKVLRHNDAGRWHAEYYKDKYLISLFADENQAFCYDNERHITQVGHVYKFNNLADHWVENNSDKDRISLIICIRHNN